MLDNLLNALRRQLRPPAATPLFVSAPDARSGVLLVQKGEHSYDVVQLPAPKGVRPNHSYDSAEDLVGELLHRAAVDAIDPDDASVVVAYSLGAGASLHVLSSDDMVDHDKYDAEHPPSELWDAWTRLLGKQHSPASLMATVRELPMPMVIVREDGPNGTTSDREIDFQALVYLQLSKVKVGTVYETAATTLRNGLVVADLATRENKLSATLPDEIFVVAPILDGGREHRVRVLVTMQIRNGELVVGLVVAPAQVARLEHEVATELRDRVQAGLGEAWSVRCGSLDLREVTEPPNAVQPGMSGGATIQVRLQEIPSAPSTPAEPPPSAT